ncbi:hypothetical protein ACEPAG_3922 [Sanghuangporus baumii]
MLYQEDTSLTGLSSDKIVPARQAESFMATQPVDKLENASKPLQTHPTVPDGGFSAWATVIGAWLMQFSTFGYINAFGVYQDFYVRTYLGNVSSSNISLIGSTQLLFLLSIGLLTGRAFDRGYFHHLIVIGTALFAFCLFMLSLSKPHQYYQVFLSQGLGLGIAMGLTYIPTMGVLAHHFQRRRTIAMGIVASGSSVGGIVHPIMLNNLFYGSVGFANGVRASAGLNLGLMTLSALLMRTRLPPKPLLPLFPVIKRSMVDPTYVLSTLGASLVNVGIFFPVFFLQLYAIEHGVNTAVAFYSITIMNAANSVGRVIPNWVAQLIGVYRMMVPCTAVAGVLIYVFLAVHDTAGILVFAVFFGFFSGVYISLLVPMLAQIERNMSELGTRMGLCFTFTGIGSFIGTPIAGALLTHQFTWWRPAVFAGTMVMFGTLLLALSGFLWSRSVRSN